MGKRTLFHCGLTADERFLHFAPHDDDTPDALDPVDLCRITGLDTEGSAGQSELQSRGLSDGEGRAHAAS